MKNRNPVTPTRSKPWKDFLSLAKRSRAARLNDSPLLPKPLDASVQNGYLAWTWYSPDRGGESKPPALKKPPPALCFAFARLADGSDEQIRQFAAKYGPLRVEMREEEAVDSWRHYARLTRALLRFRGDRVTGDRGDEDDWRVICKSISVGSLERRGLPYQLQMAILAAAVNTWFAQARGHGILAMVDGKLRVRPYASNLFGVLITQIAHVIARSDQTAVCAGCQNPFLPKRPLVRGSRQYCSRCRKAKVPQRDASRDWRRRGGGKKLVVDDIAGPQPQPAQPSSSAGDGQASATPAARPKDSVR